MKRLCSLFAITVLLTGTVFAQSRFEQQNEPARPREPRPAQNRDERQREPNRQREINSITVEGTLQLENGFIVLSSGGNVYRVPMLQRYVGFVDGIKEGGRVTVEGYQSGSMLHPRKVTVNGKDYDFPQNTVREFGPNNRGPNRNDFRGHNMQGRNKFGDGPGRGNNSKRQGRGYGRGSCCW